MPTCVTVDGTKFPMLKKLPTHWRQNGDFGGQNPATGVDFKPQADIATSNNSYGCKMKVMIDSPVKLENLRHAARTNSRQVGKSAENEIPTAPQS